MAKVILIDPEDIAHDGRPTFRKGYPDERYDVTVMRVVYKPEYREARPGDVLQFEGACYEVVSVFPETGVPREDEVGGVVTFHVNHKGAIPC